jgi:hypothetical protein
MSSSISRRTLRLHSSLVHPLLAIFVPLTFLLSADQLLRLLLPGVSWFPRYVAPLLLAAGVEEAVMGNLLFKERASFLTRVRELVLLLAIVFGALFILLGLRSGQGLRLSPLLIYPLAATMLQWFLTHGIHTGLRERELLMSALTGKHGAGLRHSLRDSSYQAGLTMRVLGNIKTGIIIFQIQIFAALIVAALLQRRPPLGGSLVVALHTIGGLLAIGVLNGFKEQQLLMGSGVPLPVSLEKRRVLFCLSILAVASALVVLAARNVSLLPLSALIALLGRLASLFHFPVRPGFGQALQNALIERQHLYEAMRSAQPPPVPSPIALLIAEAVRRLFRTLLGTGLFLFLVYPLLSKEFIDRLKEIRPLAALRSRLRTLAAFALRFRLHVLHRLRWLRRLLVSGRRSGLSVEDEPEESGHPERRRIKTRRPSVRKRLQMSRVQRAFLDLTRWGGQMGVPYAFYLTAGEYTRQLCAAVPEGTGRLACVVDVFEEVMYSTHLVASAQVARYMRSIRSLSRLTPPSAGQAKSRR